MHWIVLTGMDDEKIWEKTQEESEVAAQGESEWPGKENPFPLCTPAGGTSMYRKKIPDKHFWGTRSHFIAILIH